MPRMVPTSSGSIVNSRRFDESGIYGRKFSRNGFFIPKASKLFLLHATRGNERLISFRCSLFRKVLHWNLHGRLEKGKENKAPLLDRRGAEALRGGVVDQRIRFFSYQPP